MNYFFLALKLQERRYTQSSKIQNPREKPPMGGTPYIGFRPGGGPTFAVSLSHAPKERPSEVPYVTI